MTQRVARTGGSDSFPRQSRALGVTPATMDAVRQPETVVLICRACCCGTESKHPRTDHLAQETALAKAAAENGSAEVRVVDCLDECDRSNVAVLRKPHAKGKDRDTWLGGLLTERATGELAQWLADGGEAPLPPGVAGLRFRHVPPRKKG